MNAEELRDMSVFISHKMTELKIAYYMLQEHIGEAQALLAHTDAILQEHYEEVQALLPQDKDIHASVVKNEVGDTNG